MRFGVLGVVMRQDYVLMIKRKDLRYWSLPGGVIEEGESVVAAAEREVLEETGVRVEAKGLRGVYVHNFTGDITFSVICELEGEGEQQLVLQKNEVVDAAWMSMDRVERFAPQFIFDIVYQSRWQIEPRVRFYKYPWWIIRRFIWNKTFGRFL